MTRRRIVTPRSDEDRSLSHDVRIWKLRTYEGRNKTTYSVRWIVAGVEHHETFTTLKLADGYRAKLLSYAHKGVPFDTTTGLPEPMLRAQQSTPWFEHACRYVDMKWPQSAPGSRKARAETLATVTPALLRTERGRPDSKVLRKALFTWAFVTPHRQSGPVPAELRSAMAWLTRNTISLTDLDDPTRGPKLIRQALDTLALRIDGSPAAPTTIARKRAVFYNALQYAVEVGALNSNPIDRIDWKSPKVVETVDRRVAVNKKQATKLLNAVRVQGRTGQRLVAFFGCMYYAAMRPAEVLALTENNLASLPEEGWGELLLTTSMPRSAVAWSNTESSRERRGLKHRADKETRPVPVHPELVTLLRAHVAEFGVGRGGRLFVGERGGTLEESSYLPAWRKARRAALTPTEVRSPLARVPYQLRHAAVSTWLNAGVPATQVAEWAGHSVAVLLRTYAKCIVGQDEAARHRIEAAMNEPEGEQKAG